MKLPTIAMLALTVALTACDGGKRTAVTVEMTGDAAHGTATMACRASTSGTCYALFLTGDGSKTLDAAAGASAVVRGLAPATRFCVGASTPDPSRCRPSDLADGRQIVRHERRDTD